MLISLVISAVGVEFPFLPRHLTLVRALSVGIPGFFLALAPDSRRARPGFLHRVVRFSIPAGLIAGDPGQLLIQLLTVGIVIIFAFGVTFAITKLLARTMGLRVSDNEEEVGLDISEHGEKAYA